jgi:hypothetical protein
MRGARLDSRAIARQAGEGDGGGLGLERSLTEFSGECTENRMRDKV